MAASAWNWLAEGHAMASRSYIYAVVYGVAAEVHGAEHRPSAGWPARSTTTVIEMGRRRREGHTLNSLAAVPAINLHGKPPHSRRYRSYTATTYKRPGVPMMRWSRATASRAKRS